MCESNTNDYFFHVLLEFDRGNKNRQVTEDYVLNNITFGLKSLFGEVGAAFPVSVLQFSQMKSQSSAVNKDEYKLILTCPADCAVKFRASLTLHGSYQGERCAYHVITAADNLLSLI